MIRKIPIAQLAVGMYVHDLDCGWMDHPFLVNKFAIDNASMIRQIIEAGIKEVHIDTRRGIDVGHAQPNDEICEQAAEPVGAADAVAMAIPVSAQIDAPLQATAPPAPIAVLPSTLAEEVGHARALHSEAKTLMSGMMNDIRLGRQIEVDQCEPVVEGILDSIFRMPDALLPLAQMKTRDEYTFQHSVAVAALAAAFGRALDQPRHVTKELVLGGLLHDVGKAMVPEAILNKPGKLTDAEFAVMKSHASHSAEMLKGTPGVGEIAYQAAAQHHERFDGSGYPLGLKGDEISLYGQMLAIVDVYDAITSIRVYHNGMPPSEALKKIFEWSKFHFNPQLVHAFIKGIGIYPAGSLVRMESGRMGIVREVVPGKLLQPVVKIFYHADRQCYLPPEILDLSASTDKIIAHESFEKWKIDQAQWL